MFNNLQLAWWPGHKVCYTNNITVKKCKRTLDLLRLLTIASAIVINRHTEHRPAATTEPVL